MTFLEVRDGFRRLFSEPNASPISKARAKDFAWQLACAWEKASPEQRKAAEAELLRDLEAAGRKA